MLDDWVEDQQKNKIMERGQNHQWELLLLAVKNRRKMNLSMSCWGFSFLRSLCIFGFVGINMISPFGLWTCVRQVTKLRFLTVCGLVHDVCFCVVGVCKRRREPGSERLALCGDFKTMVLVFGNLRLPYLALAGCKEMLIDAFVLLCIFLFL